MKKIQIIIILVTLSFNICQAEDNHSLLEMAESSEIIFIGTFKERIEKLETMKMPNGSMVDDVYTTHAFEVKEVLKGYLDKSIVSVKVKGGCDQELKKCGKYNPKDYAFYKEDDEFPIMFFLDHDDLNNYYFSTFEDQSVFILHGSIEVITDTEWKPILSPRIIDGVQVFDTVILEDLRNSLGAKDE